MRVLRLAVVQHLAFNKNTNTLKGQYPNWGLPPEHKPWELRLCFFKPDSMDKLRENSQVFTLIIFILNYSRDNFQTKDIFTE